MATDIVMDDTNYISGEDEDFNPTAAADVAGSEDSDDDNIQPFTHNNSAKTAEDLDFENSGDEATIQNAKSRRKKKGKKKRGVQPGNNEDDDSAMEIDLLDEDGGEGGLIKTRAQRKAEKAERRPLAGTEGATADVDAIWARLMNAPLKPAPGIDEIEKAASTENERSFSRNRGQGKGAGNSELDATKPTGSTTKDSHVASTTDDDMITIQRTYDFAGETHTEEKRVPKDSAEARLHLSSHHPSKPASAPQQQPAADPSQPRVRRPLKRPSRFEPNPAAEIRNLPPHAALPRALYPITNVRVDGKNAAAAAAAAKKLQVHAHAPKLNTVTKSKMDWAGFVDKEGIAEELQEHEKGGKAYLDRMDFLGRVEGRRDAEAKGARGAAAV